MFMIIDELFGTAWKRDGRARPFGEDAIGLASTLL
jgi:hypothetical protein